MNCLWILLRLIPLCLILMLYNLIWTLSMTGFCSPLLTHARHTRAHFKVALGSTQFSDKPSVLAIRPSNRDLSMSNQAQHSYLCLLIAFGFLLLVKIMYKRHHGVNTRVFKLSYLNPLCSRYQTSTSFSNPLNTELLFSTS
ncbi:hypothetical protein BDV18DRAFT_130973, partial [Aspergillus unguis]